MAKKKVNKSQAVRDYLSAHPEATSGEIAAALTKKGIEITVNYAANIKTTISKSRKVKKVAKKQTAVEVAAPAAVEKKAADTVTLEQIKKVVQTVQVVGGYAHVNELLGLIKELGGVKKFKDLVDAMSPPEPDAIPF